MGVTRAERNIAWCEKHLRVPEGKFVGQSLKMAEFMCEDFRAIYDNPHGTRRAIISRGRKNAKTTESAMILLLHLAGPEARQNSQLFSAAQSRDQAAVLFSIAAKMVRMSETLAQFVGIRDTAKQLYVDELGTIYRALSAEASTAFGLSPALAIHDELGQVRGPRSHLYDALETAQGAQADPLSIVISTQAATDEDLLSVLIDDAKAGHDPRTVLRMQSADADSAPFEADTIRQANPAFDLFMNTDVVMGMADEAYRMPSKEASYRNLVLNQRVEANDPYISQAIWRENAGPVAEDWRSATVYAGLDLSAVNDLTAYVRVAWIDGKLHVRPTFWLPGDGLADKARTDRVPYDQWRDQGDLQTTPGRSVDYDYVAPIILEDIRAGVARIAFDRWNMRHLKSALERAGATEDEMAVLHEFGQGYQSISPALRALDTVLLNGRMRHGHHPVLSMCAANAIVKSDPAGNRKLVKLTPKRRIDGMVALAMAVAMAGEPQEELMPVSPWEDPDFVLRA